MAHSMKSAFVILIGLLLSASAIASEAPKNCNDSAFGKFGELQHFKLGKEISFEFMLKNELKGIIDEADNLINLEQKFKGPTEEYLPRLVEVLERPATKIFSCLLSERKGGVQLHTFLEHDANEQRKGYIIIRNGEPAAYAYTEIVQI